jgi:hypothetical protein
MHKSIWQVAVVFTLALACAEVAAPHPTVPPISVAGGWRLTGTISYSGQGITCADTLDFSLVQDDTVITSPLGAWRFQCGDSHSDSSTTPTLIAAGRVRGDSVLMVWSTEPTFAPCPSCGALAVIGRGDSLRLAGQYRDNLGGSGTWVAHRAGQAPEPVSR